MEEETMTRYVACPRRNVTAAYERFLGPSAGAFPEPWHSRTWAGLVALGSLIRSTSLRKVSSGSGITPRIQMRSRVSGTER